MVLGRSTCKAVAMLLSVCLSYNSYSKKGLLPPPTIKKHEAEMKAMGLKIPVEKLYNAQGTSLNNAVVMFGRGCTGEIISPKGLLLTNHHCGYSPVQKLSNEKNDFFANGFWAHKEEDEIPCPGLTVTFTRKMDNVTARILTGLEDTLNDAARDSIINTRIKLLEKGYKLSTGLDATIKSFYNGNQYWVILTETYRDVRLVGFPPNTIGGFGGDVENWSWPRHTGDFSLFRVYAGKDNKPADYSKANKPYSTKDFFTIDVSGYKEGDLTMVYGFPAYTREYISSFQLDQTYSLVDPLYVRLAAKKLDVLNKCMKGSREVFLKYTAKRSGIANGWKKLQGEIHGLRTNDVLKNKQEDETRFQQWAVAHDSAYPYAKGLLTYMQAQVAAVENAMRESMYINYATYGIELIQQAPNLDRMLSLFRVNLPEYKLRDTLKKITAAIHDFYKNFDVATDMQLFETLAPEFMNTEGGYAPSYYHNEYQHNDSDYHKWANFIYKTSILADEKKLQHFAENAQAQDSEIIMSDPAWQLYKPVAERLTALQPRLAQFNARMQYLNRLYMKCQMAEDSNTTFFPDANFTLRLSYGKINGIDPEGPAGYSYQTNIDETVALDNPNDDQFIVPQKLKDLQKEKNYGRWSANGTVPVAFLADNQSSGGNSGSPVLNGKGYLIGTNFDRVWEGTMSDLYFDPKVCRNISLDVRYTLFIIEKFGDAGWLLNEMRIVKGNKPLPPDKKPALRKHAQKQLPKKGV
jgi:hypothetical protein